MIETFLLYGGKSEGVYVFDNFKDALLEQEFARRILYCDGRECGGVVKKLIYHIQEGYTLDFDQRGLEGFDSSVMLFGKAPFEDVSMVVLRTLGEFALKKSIPFDISKIGTQRVKRTDMLPA